jgi:hypothetical protein
MRSTARFVFLGAILVSLAVTAPAAPSSGSKTPTCSAAQLKGKLHDSSGAAGTILLSITLQNRGSTCKLKGYPALRIANTKHLLPTHVVHGGFSILNATPTLVKLRHLGKASVLVSYGDMPVGRETSCPAGTALRLRPPAASGWLRVKAATKACGHGTLHESPVLPGVVSSR